MPLRASAKMAILPFLLLLPKPTSFSLNTPHHEPVKHNNTNDKNSKH